MPPQTRAEQSNFTQTSSYADVVAFLDGLRALGKPITFGVMGKTYEGRDMPYMVVSRPRVSTVTEARALNRPIVYVNANIHAGEVEGKEAILALVRDLVLAPRRNVLDSLVLIVVPIYNADGNEKFAPQSVNRTEQFGPALVGTRANAQGFDLNRDYVKAEAPETRASLAMFNNWQPDVYMDLHATDGSYHAFALTYSPSLNPAAYVDGFPQRFTRDTLLPEIRALLQQQGVATFDYGNFDSVYEERDITDTVKAGWYTYDHRPRFGTNYYGLRGGISILSEAYSHDSFKRRVASTYAFVSQALSSVARHADLVRGVGQLHPGVPIPVRSRLTTHPFEAPIAFEVLRKTGDSLVSQAGVPRGIRRTGRFITQRMPVYDRFEPALETPLPKAYIIPPGNDSVVTMLRLHGVSVAPVSQQNGQLSEFVMDSVIHSERSFQGHRETRVVGHWRPSTGQVPAGAVMVSTSGRLGVLATYLLDPQADDGLLDWNVFDSRLSPGGIYPVLRLLP